MLDPLPGFRRPDEVLRVRPGGAAVQGIGSDAGAYAWRTAAGAVLYVGTAADIRARSVSHAIDGRSLIRAALEDHRELWLCIWRAPSPDRWRLELDLWRAFAPPLNRTTPPGEPPACTGRAARARRRDPPKPWTLEEFEALGPGLRLGVLRRNRWLREELARLERRAALAASAADRSGSAS